MRISKGEGLPPEVVPHSQTIPPLSSTEKGPPQITQSRSRSRSVTNCAGNVQESSLYNCFLATS